MARSGKPAMAAALVLTTVSSGALAGCESTFDQNARAKLVAQRDIGTRTTPVVEERTGEVRVDAVALLRDKQSTAVVVDLHSEAGKVLTDVPITVGVVRDGEKIVLNASEEVEWFGKHLPSLAPGAKATWVFRSPPGRGGKPGDEPFVRIGPPRTPPISTASSLPALRVAVAPSADAPEPTTPGQVTDPRRPVAPGTVRVSIANGSVPQLRLPVFVVARDGDEIVAAGVGTLEELPRDTTQSLDVPVTGDPAAPAQAYATPTIFE